MSFTLRPYQEKLLADIRAAMVEGHQRVLAVMPTGAGKGVTIAEMVRSATERGHRTLILVHRQELVDDLSGRISRIGIEHGIIAARHPMQMERPVQVGSVQTVVRRLHRIPEPALIIQDEAHHLVAGNTWGQIIEAWPRAFLIGKTATPQRLSGEGLGEGHGGYFTKLVLGPTAEWLTDNGFLAPAKVYAPPGFDEKRIRTRMGEFDMKEASEQLTGGYIMGDCIEHYKKHLDGRTAIAFCCTVDHAEQVAWMFRDAGISAASIDGKMHREQRKELLAALGTGELTVLTSCMLIGEGIDVPSVGGCIQLRPTQSLSLYLQMVGRALRPQDGKTAVILDHVGNTKRHGHHLDHREWSLAGKPKGAPREEIPVKVCPSCFAANPSTAKECWECGHSFEAEERELRRLEGELVEIQRQQERERKRAQAEATTMEELVALGRRRGMKNPRGWARHVLAARQAKGHWRKVA